jgi:spore coat protein A
MSFMDRRQFVKTTAGAAALLAMRRGAYGYAVSPALGKFIQPLPLFGVNIPLASSPLAGNPYAGVDYYEVTAGWFRQQLHPAVPPTRLYGYGSRGVAAGTGELVGGVHLGNAIIAAKGKPVRIKYQSALPAAHIIPFDASIPTGTGILGGTQNRIAIHLHGGLTPWASDGGPFHWVDPAGAAGASNVAWLPDAAGVLTNDLFYPNNQSARFMWYHDHAMGTTRTSAYAGLATGYIVVGPEEAALSIYPSLILVFQDKVFWNPVNDPNYSLYVPGAQAGDLWYPYLYEKAIWKMHGNAKAAPVPSAVPEFFGDTMLVNGVVYPQANVNAGTYRVRTLNACNARFLNLKFVLEDPNLPGEPLGGYVAPVPAPVTVYIVGTEGGFLPTAMPLFVGGNPVTPNPLTPLLQAPAERADLLVDFSACAGQKVLLYNDAPAPYPMGAPFFDFYPGAPKNPVVTPPGSGPNTRTLMRFNVSSVAGVPLAIPRIEGVNPTLATTADLVNGGRMLAATPGTVITHNGVQYTYLPTTQELTLNETFDAFGRLMQLLGTNVQLMKGTFGRAYMDPATEMVKYGTIQIWNIYNLTADTHPVHFHLFNVMVLRRRPFRAQNFNGVPVFTGPGRGPDAGEEGWKETVKMWPGECTTVAVLVEDPMPAALYPRVAGRPSVTVTLTAGGGPFTGVLPSSPRTGGDEYVWHCHILEHEEHDMMRPLVANY